MYSVTAVNNFAVAGKNYNSSQTLTAPRLAAVEELIPIAWDSALTTHTSSTDGILTMANPSHLVTTGAVVDLYWLDTSGNPQVAHNVTVGTVAGTSVPFTIPTDSAFPEPVLPTLVGTDIIVGITQIFGISIVGNNLTALLAACDIAQSVIVLLDAVPAEDLVLPLLPNGNYGWIGAGTNPLTGKTVTTVHMSHADILTPHNMRVAALLSA